MHDPILRDRARCRITSSCVLFLSAALLFPFVVGCARDPNAGIYSKAALVVVVDSSLPGDTSRDLQTDELESIEKSASDAHYLFDLWSYSGSACLHLWGPSQPLDDNQTAPASELALAPVSPPRVDGDAGLALKSIAGEPALRNISFVRVIILSDGSVSNGAKWGAVAVGLKQIAARRGWRVEMLGVSPQNTSLWKSALSRALGSRWELVDQETAAKLLKENADE